MRRFMILLALSMLSCDASEPEEKQDFINRPDTYSVTDYDALELNRELQVGVPTKYRSPISKRRIIAEEGYVANDLRELSSAALRADITIERIVNFAAWLLKRKGYTADAELLASEYYARFSGFMVLQESQRGLGDHAPLLEWLSIWYSTLESKLGAKVMRITNLEHIKILNFAIPVVFNPAGKNGDWWDIVEYRNHFAGTRRSYFYPPHQHNGFAGVVAYWAVWGVCTAATYGSSGVLPFMCGPVGELSCYGVGKYVAPKLSDRIYCRHSPCY